MFCLKLNKRSLFSISVPDAPHRAFIASVSLKTSIIYSGQLRAFWDLAKASLKEKQGNYL